MMATTASSTNLDSTKTQVKRLINTQLKQVCKHAGLPVSGAKAAMQTRIITQLQSFADANEVESLLRLKSLINNPDHDPSNRPYSLSARPHGSNAMHNQQPPYSPFDTSQSRPMPLSSYSPKGIGSRGPQFKASPFFNILESLSSVAECQVSAREANRDTVRLTVSLRSDTVTKLCNDNRFRTMIYCAADTGFSPFNRVDVAFPHQIEIKVNQDEVKANLRGLKNKPGTTRPADITNLLRKRPGYNNEIAITYALTKTRFYLMVNLVEQYPVEGLVDKLKSGKIISKDRVMREMISKAQDSDVIATSTILSLKCPLSTLRIDVPCRSTVCNHNQCFDARSFLQLQEQAPTWTCPVCNKAVTFENLNIDQYVDDILKSTPKSIDQVTIEPHGNWSVKPEDHATPNGRSEDSSVDPDDDIVEIAGVAAVANIKSEGPETSMLRTPPVPSRQPSSSSTSQPITGSKRPAAAVVDLTLSSDEETEPVRAPKRQQANNASGGDQRTHHHNEFNTNKQPMQNPPPMKYPGAFNALSPSPGFARPM